MAVLIGMSAEVKGKSFEIDRDRVSIGRNTTNLITIEHPTVSGKHCCLLREGRRFSIKDLGSTNGTRINGTDVTDVAPINPKDLLQIGSIEFMFDAEASEVAEQERKRASTTAKVEVSEGPVTAPMSFGSISPFGTRSKENSRLWFTLIVVVGLLAAALVAFVLYLLLFRT